MKKNIKFTYILAGMIIVLCGSGMLMTYVNDAIQISGFFNDRIYPSGTILNDCIDINHSWGPRHYWYFWMCILLFIVMVIRCVLISVNYWAKELNLNGTGN